MSIQNRRGFTLVEIMVVVAIIALLAVLALPNMLRARLNANETAAIVTLRAIVTAQIEYQSCQTIPTFADLATLQNATPPYLSLSRYESSWGDTLLGTGIAEADELIGGAAGLGGLERGDEGTRDEGTEEHGADDPVGEGSGADPGDEGDDPEEGDGVEDEGEGDGEGQMMQQNTTTTRGYEFAMAGYDASSFCVTGSPSTPGTTGNRVFVADASGIVYGSTDDADPGCSESAPYAWDGQGTVIQ